MDNELDSAVILLVTTSTCRRGTLTEISYSGIFVIVSAIKWLVFLLGVAMYK